MEIVKTTTMHQDRNKVLIYGKPGVGKTFQASTLKDVLVISCESGLLTLQDYDIDAVEVKSISGLREVLTSLTESKLKYKTIFIDSLTEISDIVIRELEASPEYGDSKMALARWGEYSKIMDKIVKAFRDLPNYNIIFSALEGNTSDNGTIMKTPLIQGQKVMDKLPALFDFVFHLTVNEEGQRVMYTKSTSTSVAKDRSARLDTAIANPNLGDILVQATRKNK